MRTRTTPVETITASGEGSKVITTIPDTGDPTYVTTPLPWSVNIQSGDIVMHDVVTPSFKKLSSNGAIVNNPMDRTLTSECDGYLRRDLTYYFRNYYHTTHYRYDYVDQCVPYDSVSGVPSMLPVPDLDIETMKSLAINEAWAAVSKAPFQGLVALGELTETLRTIRDLLFLICGRWRRVGALMRVVRRDVRVASNLTELWLTQRYALRPLYYDLLSALDALRAIGTIPRTTYRSWEADESSNTDEVSWTTGTGSYTSDWTATRYSHRNVIVRAGILVEKEFQGISVPRALGLTVDQILPTAWELIPYSFVCDWFLDTANWIQALTPRVDARPLASWVSVVNEQLQSLEVTSHTVNGVNPGTGTGKYVDTCYGGPVTTLRGSVPKTIKTVYKERIPEASVPPIPSLSIRLSVGRIADLLALIYALFAK